MSKNIKAEIPGAMARIGVNVSVSNTAELPILKSALLQPELLRARLVLPEDLRSLERSADIRVHRRHAWGVVGNRAVGGHLAGICVPSHDADQCVTLDHRLTQRRLSVACLRVQFDLHEIRRQFTEIYLGAEFMEIAAALHMDRPEIELMPLRRDGIAPFHDFRCQRA